MPFLLEIVAQQLPAAQVLSEAQVLVIGEVLCKMRSTSRNVAEVEPARRSIARVTVEIIQKAIIDY